MSANCSYFLKKKISWWLSSGGKNIVQKGCCRTIVVRGKWQINHGWSWVVVGGGGETMAGCEWWG